MRGRQSKCWKTARSRSAIIRFRSEYRDYFEEQSVSRGFGFQILSRYRYQLLLPKTHALAEKQLITGQDLAGLPEIVHGDTFRKGPKVDEGLRRKIYTVDRLAQLRLLETVPAPTCGARRFPTGA